jgi:hypothetical protein|tara:strand:- start:334 stop:495 length:162 start_codon:yes stop_codon:yes gene_type:complete
MMSTSYRIRLLEICHYIRHGIAVPLEDMIWAEKLAHVNPSARTMIEKAREGLL